FSAEELGLWGSRAHADAARAAGDRILGVINLDMIAYADLAPEELEIFVNGESDWMGDLFVSACSRYGPVEGRKTIDPSLVYSDHAPFWDNGYPALLAIEDYPLANPYYHRTTDTLSTLDLDFFTDCTRAAVGLLAELAQPIKEGHPRTPVGLTAETAVYSSLFNSLKSIHLDWTAQADASGYNVYRATASHGGYVKINTTPVAGASFVDDNVGTGLTFFYAVTAVGPTGLESNRSREAIVSFITVRPQVSILSVTPLTLRGVR
ncbi:MAG TPA: M28 family peptidase, partial [Candidatus Aminicenantes bacterium]|nr:M28 family peptidase [Candidatus Aminicenantes bacterium]